MHWSTHFLLVFRWRQGTGGCCHAVKVNLPNPRARHALGVVGRIQHETRGHARGVVGRMQHEIRGHEALRAKWRSRVIAVSWLASFACSSVRHCGVTHSQYELTSLPTARVRQQLRAAKCGSGVRLGSDCGERKSARGTARAATVWRGRTLFCG